MGRGTRKSLKSLTNLTTGITNIAFDNSSQVMALASRAKKDQLKLVRASLLLTCPLPHANNANLTICSFTLE